jgi:hypothetical protein
MRRSWTFALFIAMVCWQGEVAAQAGRNSSTTDMDHVSLPDAPSAQKGEPPHTPKNVQMRAGSPRYVGQDSQTVTTQLILLSTITSKAPSGSSFLARVRLPVAVEGKTVLPEGSMVEGHLQTVPARRMLRGGVLRMVFDRIKLPDGVIEPADFFVTASDSKSVKFDDEGTARPTVSKKRLALQLGETATIAKLADDVSEEALAAGVGSARYYGLGAALICLAIQKGREVKLKEGDVIEVGVQRTPHETFAEKP